MVMIYVYVCLFVLLDRMLRHLVMHPLVRLMCLACQPLRMLRVCFFNLHVGFTERQRSHRSDLIGHDRVERLVLVGAQSWSCDTRRI